MANFNFNKVILGGRLTNDPELRTTPTGLSVTTFSIAVNRKFTRQGEEQQADFFNVTAWRQTAEFVTRFFHKGSSVCVLGSIQNRTWTDQQGVKHYATDIMADEVTFVDSRSENQAYGQANPAYAQPAYTQQAQQAPAQQQAQQPAYVPESYGNTNQQSYNQPAQQYQNQPAPVFEELTDDEELPF